MKTNELIEKVKQLGLETEVNNIEILIKNKEGRIICSINRSHCFQFDMDWYGTKLISDVIKEELFRIVCQHASTPIEEREKVDEKMKFTKDNVAKVIDDYFLQADFESCTDLIDEIHNLDDTTEKAAVPEFIANYLRRAKTDVGLMRVFEIANTKNELEKWKKEYNWIRKNSEKFAKAWIDDYTIEQEPCGDLIVEIHNLDEEGYNITSN